MPEITTAKTTLVVQIGNSDDKLTQREWAAFVMDVALLMNNHTHEVHFHGCSEGSRSWQNACWVASVAGEDLPNVRAKLASLGRKYRQDSVAVTAGATEFV